MRPVAALVRKDPGSCSVRFRDAAGCGQRRADLYALFDLDNTVYPKSSGLMPDAPLHNRPVFPLYFMPAEYSLQNWLAFQTPANLRRST